MRFVVVRFGKRRFELERLEECWGSCGGFSTEVGEVAVGVGPDT